MSISKQNPHSCGAFTYLKAQCYSGTRQWQNAALCYQKYLPIHDSLYTDDIQKSMDEAEAKFQNKEKQLQIKSQAKRSEFCTVITI